MRYDCRVTLVRAADALASAPLRARRFYYHATTRESSWDPPAGARIKYMDGSSGATQAKRAKKDGGTSGMWVLIGLLTPIVVPLLGLALCYWQATKDGLADALKALKKKREKARGRRGAKAGGNFRARQKLSQDGKGGRSANS